jgi:hypothetical protein
MAVNMYLIQPKDAEDDGAREQIAAHIGNLGGFILMATSAGSLLAAFDEAHLGRIKQHVLVEFVGGLSLNPQAPGAAALQRRFAENIALQLAGRTTAPAAGPAAPPAAAYPPGFVPLTWRRPTQKAGGEEPER